MGQQPQVQGNMLCFALEETTRILGNFQKAGGATRAAVEG